ncbi:MAG: Wzz/FepE/Etk N-terminal domain-containing protein [Blautia sp.]|nr:Wzz/FepE/Etk N-terminal domain-containing protein [Blautia sp.]
MQGQDNNVIEIDLEELFGLVLHRLWLILLCGMAVGLAAFAVSAFLITPKYESTTGIYVMSRQDSSNLSYSDAQFSTLLTKDYEKLITCRYVLETVIEQCGLPDEFEELENRVTVENLTDTRIIYITVKDTNPAMAQYIANSIREVASEQITAVTDVEAVNIVELANLPKEPSEPSVLMWTVLGAALGVFLSLLILVIRYVADDTIKSSEDVDRYLGWGTLALIPVIEEEAGEKSAARKNAVRRRPAPVRTKDTEAVD